MERNKNKLSLVDTFSYSNSQYPGTVKSPYVFLKRFFDIFFSLLLLIISAPIVIFFMIAIPLESPGNPFYSQDRVGLRGKTIKVVKLRSMYLNAENISGEMWAKKNDERVTKIGSFIRKVRIDELPQLINVLIGNMSLIGPRPERPSFTKKFCAEIPGFEQRLSVKPGLSGYSQVNGGYDISPREKLKGDLIYIKHFGFWMDFQIFFQTIRVVFTGDGAR